MHVSTISLTNFTKHNATEITLPQSGVVVVQGINGSGKSSLVEAVAVAAWGKTLRGTTPWRRSTPGRCEVRAGGLVMARSVTAGGKVNLEWVDERIEKTPLAAYETTTKAQEALGRIVGDLDVWRRAAVFSSHDAALFTMSTDGDRKHLLETILGLGGFDRALEACRVDLRATGKRADAAQRAVEMAEERLRAERARLDDAQKHLVALLSSEPAAEEVAVADSPKPQALEDLVSMRAAIELDLSAKREEMRALDAAGGGHVIEQRHIATALAKLSGQNCPVCLQPVSDGLRDRLRGDMVAAGELATSERAAACTARVALVAEIAELEEELLAAGERRSGLVAAQRAHELAKSERARFARQRAHLESVIASSTAATQKLEEESISSKAGEVVADRELDILVAVEKVLGLKGVRATVLGAALTGIEQIANAWLGRLAHGITIRLEGQAERKGGTVDEISLIVEGLADGRGYRAASGGERRRLDVALLFALAEVAGAASGRLPGTMFFDEVFDALDEDGIDAVSDALSDLASSRCVVVITHSVALAAGLNAALRLRVEDGRVR